MILKCHHCGKDVERMNYLTDACCFNCKTERNKLNAKKGYVRTGRTLRRKKITFAEWLAEHQHGKKL